MPLRLMTLSTKLLVVTDLDATLLDHNYSWAATEPALQQLRARAYPLVLNSSKTLAEMRPLAEALKLDSPIIAENGGLFAIPLGPGKGYSTTIEGLLRQNIIAAAHALRIREGFQFSGFADWSTDELTELTGLSKEQAEASALRLTTEPIRWEDHEVNRLRFAEALKLEGIRMLRGGRFWHLMGAADKAAGIHTVRQYYQQKEPATEWRVIALGDSANDRAMLEAADIAVVIPHADGPRIAPKAPRVIEAPCPASEGWNAAILSLLGELQPTPNRED